MRWLQAVVLAAAVALGAGAAPALGSPPERVRCSGDPRQVRPLTLEVAGEEATGRYAVPRGRARGLVVFFHGYGHTSASWVHHLARVAAQDDVITVAMDYRGTDGARGWRVAEGAEDSIAAARTFLASCRIDGPTVAHGVSMGGNASGLALAAVPLADRPLADLPLAAGARAAGPLFDWWVAVEGAHNVIETYHEAMAVAPSGNEYAKGAVEDIEAEMGGPFSDVPLTYLERTVVARADDIAASGVRGVVLVHGLGDGLVPYDQSRELAAALRARLVPVHMTTVGTRPPGTEAGTTIDGHAPVEHESPFAGHGSETDETHAVIAEGFARLRAILAGHPVTDGESLLP